MKLSEKLTSYAASDYIPFHMPGHKRNTEGMPSYLAEWCRLDITEIPEFDDLHHPEGVIRQIEEKAATLYGAERSFLLVNGSTAGVLAALSAAVPYGSHILMQRSSHRSAYHAVMLRSLLPHYLTGDRHYGGRVTLEAVRRKLDAFPIRAVYLTSPSYEGISSELREIAEYLHEREIPLIVDAAHGAHFGMAAYLPESAVAAGADISIMSLHKTLPSPTQTGLLHIQGNLTSEAKVQRFLSVYQTSSPSYPMMAAMEECLDRMAGSDGLKWEKWYAARRRLTEALQGLRHIRIRDHFTEKEEALRPECGKLMICPADGISGNGLEKCLREGYHIQAEMALPEYVLCILSPLDTEEAYERLVCALTEMDGKTELWKMESAAGVDKAIDAKLPEPEAIYTITQAWEMETEKIPLADAAGRISGEMVAIYPPGQPLIVPGECYSEAHTGYLQAVLQKGGCIHGITEDRCVTVLY